MYRSHTILRLHNFLHVLYLQIRCKSDTMRNNTLNSKFAQLYYIYNNIIVILPMFRSSEKVAKYYRWVLHSSWPYMIVWKFLELHIVSRLTGLIRAIPGGNLSDRTIFAEWHICFNCIWIFIIFIRIICVHLNIIAVASGN